MADEKRPAPSDLPADGAGVSCRDVVTNAPADEGRMVDRSDRRRRGAQLALAGVSLALVLGSAGYFALNPDAIAVDGGAPAVHMGSDADGDASDVAVAEASPEDSDGRSTGGPSDSSSGDSADFADGSNAPNSNSAGGSPQRDGGGQVDKSAADAQKPAPKTVTVSISVDSSSVGSPVSASATFTFEEGATVYDALCALGLGIGSQDGVYGVYVSSINGLSEKEYGPSSGWMYAVNGSQPNVACSAYKLGDGDSIQWRYVTGQ